MPVGLLDSLTHDSFHDSVGFCEIPTVLRRTLQRSPLVQRISITLRSGEITEKTIHEFVSSITAEFDKGAGCRTVWPWRRSAWSSNTA